MAPSLPSSASPNLSRQGPGRGSKPCDHRPWAAGRLAGSPGRMQAVICIPGGILRAPEGTPRQHPRHVDWVPTEGPPPEAPDGAAWGTGCSDRRGELSRGTGLRGRGQLGVDPPRSWGSWSPSSSHPKGTAAPKLLRDPRWAPGPSAASSTKTTSPGPTSLPPTPWPPPPSRAPITSIPRPVLAPPQLPGPTHASLLPQRRVRAQVTTLVPPIPLHPCP